MTVYRDRSDNTVSVEVLKVKFKHLGECGSARFKYNVVNGRYIPYVDVPSLKWDNENYLVRKKRSIQNNSEQVGIKFDQDEDKKNFESEFLLAPTPKDKLPF